MSLAGCTRERAYEAALEDGCTRPAGGRMAAQDCGHSRTGRRRGRVRSRGGHRSWAGSAVTAALRADAGTSDLPLWQRIRREAEDAALREPDLSTFLHVNVLAQQSLAEAVSARIAGRLEGAGLAAELIRQAFRDVLARDWSAMDALAADLDAVLKRDPAATRYLDALLYFKGFHAIEAHRLGHILWTRGQRDFALILQSAVSACLQVDIHPAARLGKGIFVDHGTGIVIGETCVIEDDVSILQNVTLGGTGRSDGHRHPKVRRGVLIGAGATILGPVEIGEGTRVGAGSVVLADVPAHVTVAGVPARILGGAGSPEPAAVMNQMFYDVGL